MGKLLVQLLVLIALGTISRCQDAGRLLSGIGAVIPSVPSSPSSDCGSPMSENFGFGGTEFTIPGSGVVYHRVTVKDFHLEFGTKTSVSLPSASFHACAVAAVGAGMEAFAFDGSCTGYKLNLHFLKCQTGDVALYVREDYLDEEPVAAPLAEAPYMVVPDGDFPPYRLYMLSDFVVKDNTPNFKKNEEFKGNMATLYKWNVIFRENGDIIACHQFVLDVDSCLNNGAYGLKVAVSADLYEVKRPTVYFIEECGNTVQVPNSKEVFKMFVYSHPGLGCKYYPSGLPDDCTVTFETEDSTPMRAAFGIISVRTDYDELIMTITGSNSVTGKTENKNISCESSFSSIRDKTAFEFYMQRQPSKGGIGFYIYFT